MVHETDGSRIGRRVDDSRDYHAFWKLYGMGLPDDVLKKLYYKNALRVVPDCPTPAGRSRRGAGPAASKARDSRHTRGRH